LSDLLINLLASVIAGVAVWSAQRLYRYRRLYRKQAFFGLTDSSDCLLSVARHFSSPRPNSVHRRAVSALIELATIARECGVRADLVEDSELAKRFGKLTEFCVGGPGANPRTAAHLRRLVPGLIFEPVPDSDDPSTIVTDGGRYAFNRSASDHGVIVRTWGPDCQRPLFILAGQTADSTFAAARYLAEHHRHLARQFGTDHPFCLIIRLIDPQTYGAAAVEVAADVTDTAFHRVAEG
jgi:hypothetical protein